jgi:hypothetical protein
MAAGAAGTASVARSRSVPGFSSCAPRQLETLQQIVTKHVEDASLNEIARTSDFTVTTTERGVPSYEHQHLIAALDVLNQYQRNRVARSSMNVGGYRLGMNKSYKHDPRTRLIELLKRWLRCNAAKKDITEDDVRRLSGLCRDVMNHPDLFPSRNRQSFMKTVAEVYQHFELQLREVLERDRTCAELAQRVLSLSRNLISDAIAYLLVGPTDLKKTDELPSLEPVSLWASLPTDQHPIPSRIDPKMQRIMRDVWATDCGQLIASILRAPWCLRLFEGSGAQEEAEALKRKEKEEAAANAPALLDELDSHADSDLPNLKEFIEKVRKDFSGTSFKNSGLAGSFRKKEQDGVRTDFLAVAEVIVDLTYLIGEALVQFHRISDGLGDYGMIRVATWLHPFLEALMEKVHRLKSNLENLNRAVDEHLIVARAKGYAVEKPAPSERMCQRARGAAERAVINNSSHVQLLLQAMEDLRQRSSPDRLPQVVEGIGAACMQLDAVLSSQQFRACVGDRFPSLPRLADAALRSTGGQPAIRDSAQMQILDAHDANHEHMAPRIIDVTDMEQQSEASPVFGRWPTGGSHTPVSGLRAAGGSDEFAGLDIDCSDGTLWTQDQLQCDAKPNHDDIHGKGMKQNFGNGRAWPLQMSSVHKFAEVNRLSSAYCGHGFRHHDKRGLCLRGDHLEVFDKASCSKVKSVFDIRNDVEDCFLHPGQRRMSLTVRKVPVGKAADSGVWSTKTYTFEFKSADMAMAFHFDISKILRRSL